MFTEEQRENWRKQYVLHCYDKLDEAWCKLESAKTDLVDLGFASEPTEVWKMQNRLSELKSELLNRYEQYFDLG